jgi:hypothetical protein
MPRLETRTNPLLGAEVEADEFIVPLWTDPGNPTLFLTVPEDIWRLQGCAAYKAFLTDGAYDGGTTSTLQILDAGGALIDQDEALRFLSKADRFDIFRQSFADSAERLADPTTYTDDDLEALARQADDETVWALKKVGGVYTWVLIKADVDPAAHEDLDTLVHELAETCYTEVTRVAGLVTNITTWQTAAKLLKVRETSVTRTSGQVSTIVERQYDAAGALISGQTITHTITRSSGRVASISSVQT